MRKGSHQRWRIGSEVSHLLLLCASLFLCVGVVGCSTEGREERLLAENKHQYERAVEWVVREVSARGATAIEFDTLRLPREYSSLSDSGEVVVYLDDQGEVETVGFFVSRGILGSSRQIVYVASDDDPQAVFDRRLAPQWYLMVTQ